MDRTFITGDYGIDIKLRTARTNGIFRRYREIHWTNGGWERIRAQWRSSAASRRVFDKRRGRRIDAFKSEESNICLSRCPRIEGFSFAPFRETRSISKKGVSICPRHSDRLVTVPVNSFDMHRVTFNSEKTSTVVGEKDFHSEYTGCLTTRKETALATVSSQQKNLTVETDQNNLFEHFYFAIIDIFKAPFEEIDK